MRPHPASAKRRRGIAVLVICLAAVGLAVAGEPGRGIAGPVSVNYVDELVRAVPSASRLAPLGDGRLLVTAKTGQVHLIRTDATSATALDLGATVCTDGDRGLLGVTAHPSFTANGRVFLYYIHKGASAGCGGTDDVGKLSQFTLNAEALTGEIAALDNIPSGDAGGQNVGGDLKAGADGNLYLAVGDGRCNSAGACDYLNGSAADTKLLSGKILRLNGSGVAAAGNAFTGGDSVSCASAPATGVNKCREIFEIGLRNPSIAMDVNASGTTYLINDEGLLESEEVDEGGLAAGDDYGWNTREANCAAQQPNNCTSAAGKRDPLYVYGHGIGCDTISAGAVLPTGVAGWSTDFSGSRYFFADKTCGKIFHLDRAAAPAKSAAPTFATGMGAISDMRFLQNTAGLTGWALYYTTSANGGELRRIRYLLGGLPSTTTTTVATTTSTSTSTSTTTTTTIPTVSVPPGSPQPGRFVALSPVRILDTRTGAGGLAGMNQPNTPRLFGVGEQVPGNATAVALNVTMTVTSGRGYVKVWPAGTVEPTVSNVNSNGANETVANAAIVMLPTSNTNQLALVSNIATHVVIDLGGYWIPSGARPEGRFVPLEPRRVLDERNPPGPAADGVGTRKVVLAGRGGVPANGASAVAFTLTADRVAGSGDARVWPFGAQLTVDPPETSVLNLNGAGDIRANLVIVPLGLDGAINLYSSVSARYIIDVAGWFTDTTATSASSGLFVPVPPQRRVDSRLGLGSTRLLADAAQTITLSPQSGGSIRAASVVHNITATQTGGAGYITAYPAGGARPESSNVNFTGLDQDRAALAITTVDDADRVNVVSNTSTAIIDDFAGYFTR